MSSGFIFGGAPLKLTMPLMEPAVAGSTEMVADFAEVEDGAGAGCELLQPESAIKPTAWKSLLRMNADKRGSKKCQGFAGRCSEPSVKLPNRFMFLCTLGFSFLSAFISVNPR